jgi:hypothetical protein
MKDMGYDPNASNYQIKPAEAWNMGREARSGSNLKGQFGFQADQTRRVRRAYLKLPDRVANENPNDRIHVRGMTTGNRLGNVFKGRKPGATMKISKKEFNAANQLMVSMSPDKKYGNPVHRYNNLPSLEVEYY